MSKAKLKKLLLSLSKEEVIDVMLQLYDSSNEASIWLDFYVKPDSGPELEKHKSALRNQFYSRNGFPKDPSFRECNKLINSFKKLIADPYAIADLMLYYVELGCSLTAQFGDFDERFYTSIENNFNKAAEFISKSGLLSEYTPRMREMIRSVEGCGWGFPDTLWDIYYDNGGC